LHCKLFKAEHRGQRSHRVVASRSAAGMTKIVGKILDAGDPDLESSDRRRSFPL
jgi:hypothetical protein